MNTITHTIRGYASRQTFHHHSATKLNKRHAINNPGQQIYHCASATTVCGMQIRIEEDTNTYTPTYNCTPTTDTGRINCKDCRKILGL